MNMTLSRKLELLTNPMWTIKTIMEYLDVGENKAGAIRKTAIIKYDGQCDELKNLVKADSVLKVIGTSRERELDIVKRTIREVGYILGATA